MSSTPPRVRRRVVCSALATALLLIAPGASLEATEPLADGLYAVWHTPRGTITAVLYPDEVPLTVANFVGLAEGSIAFTAAGREPGQPFYDGLVFHRVVPGFVVQGGDPRGDGEGGPGYTFADEFRTDLKHDSAGTLAMANSGPNTNGSQFFFTLVPVNRLNYKHTVFGQIVSGLEVLRKIRQGDAMTKVEILRVGDVADHFRPDQVTFESLRATTPVIPPRDPAMPPLFDNVAQLKLHEWMPAWLNEKLNNYQAVTDTTIWVRTVPKFEKPDDASESHNPLRSLHQELSRGDASAATLVFVENEKRWRLWLGDDLLPRFGLEPGALAEEPGRTRLHELKQTILKEAKAQLEAGVMYRSVDAAITGLIEALDTPESVSPDARAGAN